MKYVKQEIEEFLTSNLTDSFSDWNPTTTYTVEDDNALTNSSMVRIGSHYWRSLITNNLNNNPLDTENSKWMKWSVSNKYAMLDLSSLSKTYAQADLTCTFTKKRYMDTVGIGYYNAEHIKVEILDNNNVVLWQYETTSEIYNGIYNWFNWTYPPYTEQSDRSIFVQMPLFLGTKCRVTLYAWSGSNNSNCGFLVAGQGVDMGKTLTNITFKLNSYATKEIDSFGNLKIIKRAVQDIVDFETTIDKIIFSENLRKIKNIFNDIIMFILDEQEVSEFENLVGLGVIQDATPIISEFDKLIVSYSVMESI